MSGKRTSIRHDVGHEKGEKGEKEVNERLWKWKKCLDKDKCNISMLMRTDTLKHGISQNTAEPKEWPSSAYTPSPNDALSLPRPFSVSTEVCFRLHFALVLIRAVSC